jgi:hypothetical protein
LQKVTKWVIEMGILGQYRRICGFLYRPGSSSPANKLSSTTILVQQDSVTYAGNRYSSRRRKGFILLRFFLLYM